jgi:NAD(P)-dependent dehydrogenase (short-subunit alcohol dehydrogenase family)
MEETGHPKVAVITGAGTGIGRHFAQALMAKGWSVMLVGRRGAPLQSVAAGAPAGRVVVAPADVSDCEAVDGVFRKAVHTFGRVDLLFNNAGLFSTADSLENVTAQNWRQIVDTNLNGAFYCAQAAYRVMKSQAPVGGRIINNGSVSARSPRPNAVAYTATKHAITGLTKAIALEGRRYNVACSQIDIGNAATDMTAGMPGGMLQADESVRPEPVMDVKHAIDGLVYIAEMPLSANVLNLTVMATRMPLVGRG